MTAPTITGTTPLSSTSFTVSWTINNPNYDIMVIVTNLNNEDSVLITVPDNTVNSYTVTIGLNGIDNYNVSVAAVNPCGIMMSDDVTVYGKNLYLYVYNNYCWDQE